MSAKQKSSLLKVSALEEGSAPNQRQSPPSVVNNKMNLDHIFQIGITSEDILWR